MECLLTPSSPAETIAVNTRICLALIDGSLATSVPTLPAIPTSLPTITPQKDAATGPGAQIGMAMLAAAGAVAAVL